MSSRSGANTILALDAVRGALTGLAGVGAGVLLTVLVRSAIGLTPYSADPVLTIGILTGVLAYLAGLGVFKHWFRWAIGCALKEDNKPHRGWKRYFSVDTNHKVIGVQYAVSSLIFLPFAVALQIVARAHMAKLGPPLLSANAYETVISDHGVVMLFVVVLPAVSGLMNYLVPLMIGARDMAFPRLNAFSYWLVPPAGLLMVFGLTTGGFDTGWTVYPPLSSSFQKAGMDMVLLGVFIAGLSSILGAVNFLTTIIKMRAPGMNIFRMPVFVWSSLATAGLTLIFTQFIAMVFLMVLLERVLGMGFFRPEIGGSVLLYQHLFWFYSHPAVYVFVLVGLGTISDILPPFVRKPLFGYKAVAVSSPGIALGGAFVWGHHMFAAGIEAFTRIPFMVTTLLVSVPTGIKVFAWTATLWFGKLRMNTPLLFVLSSIVMFLIGGLTGVPLGIVPIDLYLHDTYWVVGHFHAMLFGGFLFPFMAAIYYWFPKVSGRMLSERLGRIQWLLMTVGAPVIFISMLGLGAEGMRRRVDDYALASGFQPLHVAVGVGGIAVFAGLIILAVNIVRSARSGAVAGHNPWDSRTLEWQVSSPPPEDNFDEPPLVVGQPYPYGTPGARHAVLKGKDK